MTLRAATRLGIIGIAMPLFALLAEVVVATVAGIPTRVATANWNLLEIGRLYLPELVMLGFLLVLWRAAAGSITPARLSDAAMAAAILLIAALALKLRWSVFVSPFFGASDAWGWIQVWSWLVRNLLEPLAWLAFLVTFVRLAEPPLQPATRRASLVLAAMLVIGGALAMTPVVIQFVISSGVPLRDPAGRYATWHFRVTAALTAFRYLLLLTFALALGRADGRSLPSASFSPPTPMPPGTSPGTRCA